MSALEEVQEALINSPRTIDELADLSGVTKTTIYKFLNGQADCRLGTIIKLLEAVGKKVKVIDAHS